ncbi:MAG: hypothetical protein AABW88_00155 [Nanoarchaeota archaeon]
MKKEFMPNLERVTDKDIRVGVVGIDQRTYYLPEPYVFPIPKGYLVGKNVVGFALEGRADITRSPREDYISRLMVSIPLGKLNRRDIAFLLGYELSSRADVKVAPKYLFSFISPHFKVYKGLAQDFVAAFLEEVAKREKSITA